MLVCLLHGIAWFIMVLHGRSWHSMAFHGIAWHFMAWQVGDGWCQIGEFDPFLLMTSHDSWHFNTMMKHLSKTTMECEMCAFACMLWHCMCINCLFMFVLPCLGVAQFASGSSKQFVGETFILLRWPWLDFWAVGTRGLSADCFWSCQCILKTWAWLIAVEVVNAFWKHEYGHSCFACSMISLLIRSHLQRGLCFPFPMCDWGLCPCCQPLDQAQVHSSIIHVQFELLCSKRSRATTLLEALIQAMKRLARNLGMIRGWVLKVTPWQRRWFEWLRHQIVSTVYHACWWRFGDDGRLILMAVDLDQWFFVLD